LDESLELALGELALGQVYEVRPNASLGEESQRFPGFRAFLYTKDLNFHSLQTRGSVTRSGRVRREYTYRPAWWLPGAHAQTLWGKLGRRVPRFDAGTRLLRTPDGDNLEIVSLPATPSAPRVLLLHGLEGSRASHYVGGMFSHAARRGWGADLLVFRGCGTAANEAGRFYHSGETSDLAFAFGALVERWPNAAWCMVGVSLGGNVLVKWLGENGNALLPRVRAAAAISVPFDLEAGARKISRGASRIYDRSFLRSLRRKALAKLATHPGLFDRARLEAAQIVFEFDDAVTGPVHGFRDARDYYAQSSSMRYLADVRVPTLLLSAADDPFLPAEVLQRAATLARGNPALTVEFHAHGGHVGFVTGAPWRPRYYAEWRAFAFFADVMEHAG
jgi:predicted alpha/beta-fold hydrolase